MEAPRISPNTNSEVGSRHWYNTLLAKVLHIGEFMKSDRMTDADQKRYGQMLMDYSRELIDVYEAVQDSERTITIRPSQLINAIRHDAQ